MKFKRLARATFAAVLAAAPALAAPPAPSATNIVVDRGIQWGTGGPVQKSLDGVTECISSSGALQLCTNAVAASLGYTPLGPTSDVSNTVFTSTKFTGVTIAAAMDLLESGLLTAAALAAAACQTTSCTIQALTLGNASGAVAPIVWTNAQGLVQDGGVNAPLSYAIVGGVLDLILTTSGPGTIAVSALAGNTYALNDLGLWTGGGDLKDSGVNLTALVKTANNLSDLASPATARTNLGLGTAATKAVSNGANATVASTTGAFVAGHLLWAADANGTVQDGGAVPAVQQQIVALAANTSAAIASGAVNLTVVGSSPAIALTLPSSPAANAPLHLVIADTVNPAVQLWPASGQSISDCYSATPGPFTLRSKDVNLVWNAAASTWQINGCLNAPAPSLAADFINGVYSLGYLTTPASVSLSSLWTITNATTGSTYMNGSGQELDTPSANYWRASYSLDPSHAFLGYFAESARQELMANTTTTPIGSNFAVASGGGGSLATSIAVAAPYQGANPATVWATTATGTGNYVILHPVSSVSTLNTNIEFDMKVWIPPAWGGTALYCTETGTGWTQGVSTYANVSKRGQWQTIYCLAQQTSQTTITVTIRSVGTTQNSDTIYLTEPQFTVGSQPGSFIPTTTVALTRAADVIAPVSNANVDLTQGATLVADIDDHTPSLAALTDLSVAWGAAPNAVTLQMQGDQALPSGEVIATGNSMPLFFGTGGVASTLPSTGIGSTLIGTPLFGAAPSSVRMGAAMNDNDLAYADSGGAVASGTQAQAVPNVEQINIAPGATNAGAILRGIYHYPARLSPAVLASVVSTDGPYTVTVNPSSPGATVPLNFVGPSFENSFIANSGTGTGNGPLSLNVGLKNILGVLGAHGHIRFGGNSCDNYTPLFSRWADSANFVASFGTGWTSNYCFSWQIQSPNTTAAQQGATDALQAAAVVGVLGAANVHILIGNEPEFYTTYATYATQWATIESLIAGAVASAQFAGPEAGPPQSNSLGVTFTTSFISGETGVANEVTGHIYGNPTAIGPTGVKYIQKALIPTIWADKSAQYFTSYIEPLAAAQSMTCRITESGSTNAVTGGQGLGNTLGGAVWDVWEMVQIANAGCGGVNFHGGNSGPYSPMVLNSDNATYSAQSTLYAMMLFNYLTGGQILPFTTNTPGHVTVFAVLGADGKTRVLLINESTTKSEKINLASTGSFSNAYPIFMTAPSYLSTNVTLGGATITSAGTVSPYIPTVPAVGGLAQVVVPPSSAAVVTLQ